MGVSAALGATLPVVVDAVPAEHPDTPFDPVSVLLELTVDVDGSVVNARVVEPVDPTFDDAALLAARATTFSPALDDAGEPAAAVIRYTVVFDPTGAPPVSLRGVAMDDDGTVVAGVEVVARSADGRLRLGRTDDSGVFELVGMDPAPWDVSVYPDGVSQRVVLGESVTPELVLRVEPAGSELGGELGATAAEVIEVRADKVPPELIERRLDAETIAVLPGTGGDVVKAVQNLSGLNRAPLGVGQLLIRGTAPEDSAYYLDGVRIPLVFHFSGLSTVINGDMLDTVSLMPGNYGVRYGRTVGGLVDMRTRAEIPEVSSGYASVDLFQATMFVRQRVSDRTAVTLSGRRSYIDAVLNPVLAGSASSSVQAPRYYDLQARVLHRDAVRNGTWDALLVMSDDGFRVVGDPDGLDDSEVQIGLSTRFAKLRLERRVVSPSGWVSHTAAMVGPEVQSFVIAPDGQAREGQWQTDLRHELQRSVGPDTPVGWRLGLDSRVVDFDFLYDVPAFGAREEAGSIGVYPALYGELSPRVGPLTVIAGLRGDGMWLDSGYTALAVDPRLATVLQITDTTSLRSSFGKYSQFAQPRQVTGVAGEPGLRPQHALQASLGLDQQIRGGWSLEATAFASALRELVVGREDAFRFFTGPPPSGPLDTGPYANEGVGTVVGGELMLRYEGDRTTALVAATMSQSTRRDREDGETEWFEYDQPLVGNALVSHELAKGWRMGSRLRFGSGNPYTPVVNRVFDLDTRTFVPVYSDEDSRLPAFLSLDVRIDKEWTYERWALTAYLDVQNATNTTNIEVMSWTYDYGEEEGINGLPIIPAFGLEAAW